jgi:MFS family permease
VFRNRPSDKGLLPYGSNPTDKIEKKKDRPVQTAEPPVTVSVGWKVLRENAGFWVFIFGFVCMGVVNGAIVPNAISNMTAVTLDGVEVVSGGHSTIWAGYVWSYYLVMVIFAKIFLGFIYDRWGLKTGTIAGTIACMVASVGLCFPFTVWGPLLFATTFGFGTCMGSVAPPVMMAKQYGSKDIGLVVGIITAFQLFGVAIGAVVSGFLFDAFLTFVPAWIMVLVASIFMGVSLMIAIPASQRLVARRKAEGAPELNEEGLEIGSE